MSIKSFCFCYFASLFTYTYTQVWVYVTFTWDSQFGLEYYQDGVLVSKDTISEPTGQTASDAFTVLSLGKPNSIDNTDYYGNMYVSDLIIWEARLMSEEVLHSYDISSKGNFNHRKSIYQLQQKKQHAVFPKTYT